MSKQIDELMRLADIFAEYRDHSEYVHTRNKLLTTLEAVLKDCRNATLEMAAKVCEKECANWEHERPLRDCAKEIRSLKT